MADVTRRIVSFAGSSVRIDSMDEAASHLVAFLFDRLAQVEGPPPHAVLRVRAEDQSARTLHIDGELYCEVDSLGSLASALLEQTLFRLSDRSTGGLLLHAAAVSRGSRCILLPGTSGAGKSSLTAWLLKQGFEYLTDELVYVPFGSLSVQPFTRPLALKASARGQLGADVVDFDGLGPQILSSPDV